MAEIVGTAYVRIRALTKQLSKEIKDGVNKGVKDAKVEQSGEDAGEAFTDGFTAQVGEGVPEALDDSLGSDSQKRSAEKSGKGVGGSFAEGFTEEVDKKIPDAVDDALSGDSTESKAEKSGKDVGVAFTEGFSEEVGVGIPDAIEHALESDDHKKSADRDGRDTGAHWTRGFLRSMDSVWERFAPTMLRTRAARTRVLAREGRRDGDAYGDGILGRIRARLSRGTFNRRTFSRLGSSLLSGLSSAFSSAQDLLANLLPGGSGGGGGLDKVSNWAENFGKRFVSSFTKGLAGLGSVLKTLVLNPITLIGSAIVALGPLLVQTVVGLTAVLGSLVTALGGGVVGLLGAGTSLLGFLPIVAAFMVPTAQLELFKEELAEVLQGFYGIVEVVQNEVLPAVLSFLKVIHEGLAGNLLLFSDFVGKAFADFVEIMGRVLTSGRGVERVGRILTNAAAGFRGFLTALVPLFDGLLSFFAAASSLAPVVAEDMRKLADSFRIKMDTKGLDALSERLLELYEDFKELLGALTDFTIGLWNIFVIASEDSLGGGVMTTFREWAANFREMTTSAEGVSKIRGYFERAMPVLKEFAGLLKDITILIFEGGTNETGTNRTVEFLQWLREDAIPWITDVGIPKLSSAFSAVWTAIAPLVDTLGVLFGSLLAGLEPVGAALAESFDEHGPGKIQQISDALSGLAEPLGKLGEALGRFIGPFFDTLAVSAPVMGLFLSALILVIDAFTTLLTLPGVPEFLGVIAGIAVTFFTIVKVAGLLATAFTAVSGAVSAVGAGLSALGGVITAIAAAFGVVITLPAWAVGLLAAAIVGLVYVIVRNWDTIVKFFTETLPDALGRFWEWIKTSFVPGVGDALGGLWESISGFVTGLPGRIGEAISSLGSGLLNGLLAIPGLIGGALTGIGDTITGAFGAIPDLLGGALSGIGGAASSALGTLGDIGSTVWDAVSGIPETLLGLGGLLLEAIGSAITWVATELPLLLIEWSGAFAEFVVGIPLTLLDMGIQLIASISYAIFAAGQWLVTQGIPTIVNFFKSIPSKIGEALTGLGNFLTDKLGPAFETVKTFVQEKIDQVVQFFRDLPGNIRDALVSFGTTLRDVFSAAYTAVSDYLSENIPKILDFFRNLPGQIIDFFTTFATEFPGKIREGLESAKNFVVEAVTSMGTAISDFISSIPEKATEIFNKMVEFGSKLVGGIKDGLLGIGGALSEKIGEISDAVISGIKSFVNSVMEKIEKALSFDWGPFTIDMKGKLPRFAKGGIFDSPTYGLMGEAGKEVLLPLTNPARTYQLALQSGLFDVLNKYRPSRDEGRGVATAAVSGAPTAVMSRGRQVTFQPGAVVVEARGLSADEAFRVAGDKLNWALTSRGDR